MPSVDDKSLALAGPYSAALLRLAREQGREDEVLDELREIAVLFERDPAFADFVASPLVDADARRASLEKALRGRASDLLVDALQVLNRKGRLGLLPALAESYRQAHRDWKGIVDVEVRTAVPLTEALRERLREAAGRFTGKEAYLIEAVDPALLGGMVVQIGDQKIDSSIASRLKDLSRNLLERGSEEIHRGAAAEGSAA